MKTLNLDVFDKFGGVGVEKKRGEGKEGGRKVGLPFFPETRVAFVGFPNEGFRANKAKKKF